MFSWLNDFLQTLPAGVWNLLLLISAIVIGFIIRWLFSFLAKKAVKPDGNFSLLRSILNNFSKPLTFIFPIIIFDTLLPLLKVSASVMAVVSKITEILLTVGFTILLVSIVNIITDYVVYKYRINKTDNLKERKIRTQLQFVRKMIVTIIIICAVCIVLLSFDSLRKLGAGLLTGVGIGGIIIGFAAQKSLANILAGFQIAFTQPLRIDDVLVVEGEWGRVEEITLTYVVLNIWDQRRLILPINYFIEKPFQNWTRTHSELLSAVMMYLDYTIPIEEVRSEFNRVLQQNPLWDKRVGVLQVTNFTERTVEIRMLVSTFNSGNGFDLRCQIREAILKFLLDHYPGSLPHTRIIVADTKGI